MLHCSTRARRQIESNQMVALGKEETPFSLEACLKATDKLLPRNTDKKTNLDHVLLMKMPCLHDASSNCFRSKNRDGLVRSYTSLAPRNHLYSFFLSFDATLKTLIFILRMLVSWKQLHSSILQWTIADSSRVAGRLFLKSPETFQVYFG